MTKRKSPKHVSLGHNSLRCWHCGDEDQLPMPMSLRVAIAMSEDFSEKHARCEPSSRAATRMRYATPEEWLASWDTGVSSITIFRVMTGRPPLPEADVPHDPADFGRCVRLLRAFPEWRARLDEMRAMRGWAPLVDAWPRLEELFDAESASGAEAPQLYAAMSELRGRAA